MCVSVGMLVDVIVGELKDEILSYRKSKSIPKSLIHAPLT